MSAGTFHPNLATVARVADQAKPYDSWLSLAAVEWLIEALMKPDVPQRHLALIGFAERCAAEVVAVRCDGRPMRPVFGRELLVVLDAELICTVTADAIVKQEETVTIEPARHWPSIDSLTFALILLWFAALAVPAVQAGTAPLRPRKS